MQMFDIPTHFTEAIRLQNSQITRRLDRIIELLELLTRDAELHVQPSNGDGETPVSEDTTSDTCPCCLGNKQLLVEMEWEDCSLCDGTGKV